MESVVQNLNKLSDSRMGLTESSGPFEVKNLFSKDKGNRSCSLSFGKVI